MPLARMVLLMEPYIEGISQRVHHRSRATGLRNTRVVQARQDTA